MPKGLIENQLQFCLKLKAECILYLVGYMNKIDFISLIYELCSWFFLFVSFSAFLPVISGLYGHTFSLKLIIDQNNR